MLSYKQQFGQIFQGRSRPWPEIGLVESKYHWPGEEEEDRARRRMTSHFGAFHACAKWGCSSLDCASFYERVSPLRPLMSLTENGLKSFWWRCWNIHTSDEDEQMLFPRTVGTSINEQRRHGLTFEGVESETVFGEGPTWIAGQAIKRRSRFRIHWWNFLTLHAIFTCFYEERGVDLLTSDYGVRSRRCN